MFWRLQYGDRFVANIQPLLEDGSVPDDGYAPFFFPEGGAFLPFFFTAETFKRVYTALLNGADLTYGEGAQQVVWDFQRNVEFPVSICDQIIDCIENNPATADAIANALKDNDIFNEYIDSLINAGRPIDPETGLLQNDDLNRLFGAITFLVDTIHDAIVDFNQDAETSSNQRELGQIVFAAIPVLETLPFNEMSEYADVLFEQIIEVFDSQWDTTPITGTRDRIRCALFCIARDNGNSLTWDLIQGYFYGRTGFTWSGTINIMLEFAQFLLTGVWEGEEVVDIAFGNFVAAMAGTGKFGEMFFPSLSSIMRLGQNTPDSDWEIICLDCTGVGGFVVYGTPGVTSVDVDGTTYTFTGGFGGGVGSSFLYVGPSVDGTPETGAFVAYSELLLQNFTVYDWGDGVTSYNTVPPSSSPPPNVAYAGGSAGPESLNVLSITITTDLPFQGVVAGT